ncbi:MAG: 30S ribosomal protein S7 [Pseudomonadota bacterium]|uniref:Small ribosomal subunit protein uS7 n=1 Tax=Candidatus Desulfatibia profunda TaxID=2841695 RepID=A0A8J6NV57_9BACT|nr:30S ribosomal protein S7 [Candidatus Desulfatibia profunda]MBL7180578.1 30S ribosomal protein S7 [Desulfobacterales bacterium]
MPRRREIPERTITFDYKYNNRMVSKFIKSIMRDGKKSLAESILYDALDVIEKRAGESPLKIFEQALENVKPMIEVKSRRVGGSTYQVPTEIRPSRRMALGIRWIIDFARKRSERSMAGKLAGELMDASNKRGASVKKKEDTHKMAEANKAFAHYRW